MRIVVLGGTGFLGRRTVSALGRVPGVHVEVASRRGPIAVDLARAETFAALEGADVVVDLADGTRARSDALARWCIEHGPTLIEATSDAPAIRRLAAALEGIEGPGRVVLGGGIFTGMSNLLARDVATRVGAPSRLTWAVASSPYSGAGASTVALMVEATARPTVRTSGGKRVEGALERGPRLDFGGVTRPTLRMSVAEAEMLPRTIAAPEIDTFFAPRPGFLVPAFSLLPAFLLSQRWFRGMLEIYFTLLRRVLLRAVSTAVEQVAIAEGTGVGVQRTLRCRDGMEAGAWALAVIAEAVARRRPPHALAYVDDVVALEPIAARMNELSATTVIELGVPEAR